MCSYKYHIELNGETFIKMALEVILKFTQLKKKISENYDAIKLVRYETFKNLMFT